MERFSKYSLESKRRIALGVSLGVAVILIILFVFIHFKSWIGIKESGAFGQFSLFYKTLINGSQGFFNK